MGTTSEDFEARTTTVSPREAADRLGIERSTLANWRWNGKGPPYLKIGGRVRYRLSDLATYLDGRIRKSTSDRGPHA